MSTAELTREQRSDQQGVVYFVWFPRVRRWKIGYTDHSAEVRMRGALTFCPDDAVVIAEVPGDPALERRLHTMFSAARVDLPGRNEIFEDCEEIRRLIADAPLLAEIKSLGVPLTQLDDFDWGTTGLGGKGYSKNPEDGLTRSIPLMNKIRALRSMVAVMDRKCEAEFVVASWNRLFEKTHAGLFDVQIDSKKTEGYFVECEWRDRSRGDRYWGAPKGHDAAAHYLCTVEQGDLPFAWVVLFLHNESHAGRGDKDLAEKFYWLRKLCEEQCGAFEVHHSTKEVLPRLVSEAIGRLPASLVSVELLLAQCWVLAEAIQNDRVVRVVVASQFTQFNSFESHAQATPCWLLEKVTRMQLAASEAA